MVRQLIEADQFSESEVNYPKCRTRIYEAVYACILTQICVIVGTDPSKQSPSVFLGELGSCGEGIGNSAYIESVNYFKRSATVAQFILDSPTA